MNEQQLTKAVIDNPTEWEYRLVLADWHEEMGDQLISDRWRWSGEQQKTPYCAKTEDHKQFYLWFNEHTVDPKLEDPSSNIPAKLWEAMNGDTIANHKIFKSLEEAESALSQAWVKVGGV